VVAGISADGPLLVAILDTLGDVYDLIDARLSRVDQETAPHPSGAGRVRHTAPAVRAPAGVPLREPATPAPAARPGPPPPRHGRGSGTYFWEIFARNTGVTVPAGASRAEIIEACVAAGVLPAEEPT
jgi:hypothetical protein